MSAEQLGPHELPQDATPLTSVPDTRSVGALHAGQNSPLRERFKHVAHAAGKWIDDTLPAVDSDHLTLGGVLLVATGTVIAARSKTWKGRAVGAAFATAGNVVDLLDGAHSRARDIRLAEEKAAGVVHAAPEEEVKTGLKGYMQRMRRDGGVVDYLADRADEIIMSSGRLYVAYRRESALGVAAAIGAMKTGADPSEERARAELIGRVVPEGDKIGTRPGRATIGVVGLLVPEMQPVLDTLTTRSSLRTAKRRRAIRQAKTYTGVHLGEKEATAARNRLTYIPDVHQAVNVAIGTVTLFSAAERIAKRHNEKKKQKSQFKAA